MEDNEILELYWSRDEQAIAETQASYGVPLLTLANRILSSREDSEETVSDTFLRAWQTIPPERPKDFLAFLRRICRNLAFDRLDWNRAAKRNPRLIALTAELEQCIPDLRQGGRAVDAFSVQEHGYQQLAGLEIADILGFPCGIGVKEHQRLVFIQLFIINRHIIGDGLAVIPVIKAIDLFEMGNGDLFHIFTAFDLGNDLALFVFHGSQLIHAAEHRLALGGDEPLADAEHVDARALIEKILDQILVEGVRHGDLAALPARLIQHPPGLYVAISAGAVLLLLVFLPDLFPERKKEKSGTGEEPEKTE